MVEPQLSPRDGIYTYNTRLLFPQQTQYTMTFVYSESLHRTLSLPIQQKKKDGKRYDL